MVLIDLAWCCHRFLHAYSGKFLVRVNGQERDTGQKFGFCRLLQSILRFPTTEVVFCLDQKPTDREGLLPSYKEGREVDEAVYSDLEEIYKIVTIPAQVSLATAEGREADDLMAQLFFEFYEKSPERPVILYTGDNDLLQLIPKGARVARKIDKGDFEYVGEEYIVDKYGVDSSRLLRYRVLVGDSSDKIPPVVPRMSREFVRRFVDVWMEKTLDECLVDLSLECDNLAKLRENRSAIVRNLKLINLIKYQSEKQRFPYKRYRCGGGEELLDRYQLRSFKRFLSQLNETQN